MARVDVMSVTGELLLSVDGHVTGAELRAKLRRVPGVGSGFSIVLVLGDAALADADFAPREGDATTTHTHMPGATMNKDGNRG